MMQTEEPVNRIPAAGIIFDMDGVLLDSEYPRLIQHLDFLKSQGVHATVKEISHLAGTSADTFWPQLGLLLPDRPDSQETMRRHRIFWAAQPPPPRSTLFKETRQTLASLHRLGIPMAVASSSGRDSIQRALEEGGVAEYLKGYVSGMDCVRSKPDPEIYRRALALLDLPAEVCFAVEDSVYGICAAKAAGLRVVARQDKRMRLEQSGADYSVSSLRELLAPPFAYLDFARSRVPEII